LLLLFRKVKSQRAIRLRGNDEQKTPRYPQMLRFCKSPIPNHESRLLMDRKLLDILCCPASRQPLALLETAGLDALNRAIAAGQVKRIDDTPQADPLRQALITGDRKTVYRIDDGIPVLLVEEGIATAQVADFPRK
jgi:uncharacterized protein YbaR (Trm112 family)